MHAVPGPDLLASRRVDRARRPRLRPLPSSHAPTRTARAPPLPRDDHHGVRQLPRPRTEAARRRQGALRGGVAVDIPPFAVVTPNITPTAHRRRRVDRCRDRAHDHARRAAGTQPLAGEPWRVIAANFFGGSPAGRSRRDRRLLARCPGEEHGRRTDLPRAGHARGFTLANHGYSGANMQDRFTVARTWRRSAIPSNASTPLDKGEVQIRDRIRRRRAPVHAVVHQGLARELEGLGLARRLLAREQGARRWTTPRSSAPSRQASAATVAARRSDAVHVVRRRPRRRPRAIVASAHVRRCRASARAIEPISRRSLSGRRRHAALRFGGQEVDEVAVDLGGHDRREFLAARLDTRHRAGDDHGELPVRHLQRHRHAAEVGR